MNYDNVNYSFTERPKVSLWSRKPVENSNHWNTCIVLFTVLMLIIILVSSLNTLSLNCPIQMRNSRPPRDFMFTVLSRYSAGVVEDAALCYGSVLLLKWFLTHVVVVIKPADVLRRSCFVFLIRKRWQLHDWVCKINNSTYGYICHLYSVSF